MNNLELLAQNKILESDLKFKACDSSIVKQNIAKGLKAKERLLKEKFIQESEIKNITRRNKRRVLDQLL